MENISLVIGLSALAFLVTFTLALSYSRTKDETLDYRMPVTLAGAVSLISLMLWLPLRPDAPHQAARVEKTPTLSEQIENVQTVLRANPNDGQAWFELGQGYMAKNEFESASTCFDYAIRLSDSPEPGLYSAKASADYYQNKQAITQEVRSLLDKALAMNPVDQTALTLIATDHYISFRYQKAIDTWQKMLDSQKSSIDRVSIIRSINLAKQQIR